jgi:beta-1,4-N-acetylglucosaminyltransferase
MSDIGRRILVTVGSTGFDALISVVTSWSFLLSIARLGYYHISIQYGNSHTVFQPGHDIPKQVSIKHMEDDLIVMRLPSHLLSHTKDVDLYIQGYSYCIGLMKEIQQSDLVISHAGSGTILDVLRCGRPLIVVPNRQLMDNHQLELALEMHQSGYLIATDYNELIEVLYQRHYEQLKPFPHQASGQLEEIIYQLVQFNKCD